MTSAAIYARVSSARQREEQTIVSQTTALREAAEHSGLEVPGDWVFEDEGYSGATLVRPALEQLRDLAAQVPIDVVLCYSPDRLARKLRLPGAAHRRVRPRRHRGPLRQGSSG